MRGRFITFEGGEGTGKSTHSALLAARLQALGIRVLLGRTTTAVLGNGHVEGVALSDDSCLEADLVVVCALNHHFDWFSFEPIAFLGVVADPSFGVQIGAHSSSFSGGW